LREILRSEGLSKGTDPSRALRELRGYLKKQSVIFYISDFEKLPDQSLIKEYSIKHEFMAFGVFHSRLQSFPAFPFVEMEASESGKPFTVATDTAAFHFKVKSEQKRIHDTARFFKSMGVPFLHVNESQDFLRPLENFLKG
jgi:hypothetical protein